MPRGAAIASESPYTVEAGRHVAAAGGNAVDIAVGAAIAATVSETLRCSLGGSAFICLKLPGREPELIDGGDAMPRLAAVSAGERAWRTATVPYGDGIDVNVGHGSVAVPGMLRALELAWQRHGSLPWVEVVAPAVELARTGLQPSQTLVKWLEMAGRPIFYQQGESRASFFPDGENALRRGEFYQPPHLVDTLELIGREGADALYRGDLAAAFAAEMEDHGGWLRREDLEAYRAEVRRPLQLSSHGFRLALNPPPSIGGAMLASMVRLFEQLSAPRDSEAARILHIARAQRVMFDLRNSEGRGDWNRERAEAIIDPDWLLRFMDKVFAPNTMHTSTATSDGAVVAITMSNGYGSGISIPGTGIPTNNSLGEPELNPAGFFRIPAGGRLVSNMAPTVAWHDNGTTLAMGSPGASRITTTLMQAWLGFAWQGLSFEDMVRAPRLHVERVQGEFVAQYEPGLDMSLVAEHFRLRPFDAPDMYFGACNVAGTDADGRLHALADGRRHGAQWISRG